MFYINLMKNAKQKPTADNEKGIKAYDFRKPPIHKGREKE